MFGNLQHYVISKDVGCNLKCVSANTVAAAMISRAVVVTQSFHSEFVHWIIYLGRFLLPLRSFLVINTGQAICLLLQILIHGNGGDSILSQHLSVSPSHSYEKIAMEKYLEASLSFSTCNQHGLYCHCLTRCEEASLWLVLSPLIFVCSAGHSYSILLCHVTTVNARTVHPNIWVFSEVCKLITLHLCCRIETSVAPKRWF